MRQAGKRVVVTNGCFDILHLGHVSYLEAARECGDVLLVGVNADDAVRQLKGEGRPINCERDRAAVVAALESVGVVSVFPERTAVAFLKVAEPDVYVKGGDYTLQTLNAEERRAVEKAGGRIEILPLVPNRSTTLVAGKITARPQPRRDACS
jgi:D-glycero-beta-D-manno-heptose 1-phosphate adenylyltransferase